MILASTRLTFRLHRFGVVGISLIVLGLAALAVWYAARLDGFASGAACAGLSSGPLPGEDAEAAIGACLPFFGVQEEAGRVVGVMAYLPIVAGLFLGVPIVAQELDRGTTPLAWSLEPSRWRWLLGRAVPLVGLAVVLGLVAGAAADHLEARLLPGVDPWASFHSYGLRGPIVAARIVLLLGCGLLVGALLGRTLSAMLVGFVVGALLLGGLADVHSRIQRAEATPTVTVNGEFSPTDLPIDTGYRLPSGEILTYDQLRGRYPNPGEFQQAYDASEPLAFVIAGERYPIVAGREALATAGLGLVLIAATLPVVSRRRADPGRVRLAIVTLGRRSRPAKQPRSVRAPGPLGTARLALWPHRMEIAVGVAVGVAASIAGVLLLAAFSGLSAPAHCYNDRFNVPIPPDCTTTERYVSLVNEWGGRLFAAMAVLPWLVGSLIGVVVVGREIEQRTATLAWSLSPDRRRWLVTRALIAAGVVVLLLAVPSIVASETERLVYPWTPTEASFNDYALRGHLVVARGVAGFAVALLIGAVIGRVLPALLLAGAGCVAMAVVLGLLLPFGQPSETLPERDYSIPGTVPLYGSSIPGERLREVELRETLFLGAVTISLVGATAVVVERRRPT